MKAVRHAARLTFSAGFAAALLALAPLAAHAQDDDKKMRPVCKMSDPDVHLTGDGWSGPKCITADAAGQPVASALAAEKERVAKANKDAKPGDKAKPPCKPGDPGVMMTNKGYAGPNCVEADFQGKPVN